MPIPTRTWDRRDFAPIADRFLDLRYLYRYVGVTGDRAAWLEDLVLRSQLYFPSFASLNDPFDGSVPFAFDAAEEEIQAYWEDAALDHDLNPAVVDDVVSLVSACDHQLLRSQLEAHTAKLGVACFSETETDVPMWSYYAEGHRGACLRFDAQKFSSLDGCVGPVPVTYQDDRPIVNFYRTKWFQRITAMVLTKATAWKHEREWRVVRHVGEGPIQYNPDALDALILGCKMPAADRARIAEMLTRRGGHVELLHARASDKDFSLKVEQVAKMPATKDG